MVGHLISDNFSHLRIKMPDQDCNLVRYHMRCALHLKLKFDEYNFCSHRAACGSEGLVQIRISIIFTVASGNRLLLASITLILLLNGLSRKLLISFCITYFDTNSMTQHCCLKHYGAEWFFVCC